MKVLFLLRSSIFNRMGGSEIQANFLAHELKKMGHKIYYIFDSNINNTDNQNQGIIYYNLTDYGNLFSWLNFFSIGKLIDEIDPDIIYQRVRSVYTGIASYYASKNSSIKMVYNVASNHDCIKNKIKFKNFPKILKEYAGRYGIKKADQIISQTWYQKKLLKENFNRECVVIPNGHVVPMRPFKKRYPPIITWIANIKPFKQTEIFINLAESCHDLDAKFIYTGRPAKGNYQKMLKKRTKKLQNLEYLGEIPYEKTNELLSKSSLLINTSITEGFSNTYIQAWMRETPVVTLNCDPDNIIKSQKIGFHSGSIEQLFKDVRYLIENENVRREMGEKARTYAIENHDIKKIGKRYNKVFSTLLNNLN